MERDRVRLYEHSNFCCSLRDFCKENGLKEDVDKDYGDDFIKYIDNNKDYKFIIEIDRDKVEDFIKQYAVEKGYVKDVYYTLGLKLNNKIIDLDYGNYTRFILSITI